MIDYDNFEQFRDPITYDVQCDNFDEDFAAIEQWARRLGNPLLDLACGTGRMAIHLASLGHQVTGVEVVPEMIERARQKAAARGVSIEWVVDDARTFNLQRQFPFIFMLGSAFQFLPTRADHEAMFARVRQHLHPGGYFLFETRNPSPRNLYELLQPDDETFALPDGGQLVVSEAMVYDPMTQIQHYTRTQKFYYANGQSEENIRRTALRYVFPQEIEALLHYNGFKIDTCYGDWQQNPLVADSPAMIYVCQKRA